MSVWTRLFGRSETTQRKSEPRLGLESLELREVPAVVFVGGWGASAYQYAHTDPAPAALPSVTDLIVDPFHPERVADAADYSAVVFVGGWGASAPQHDPGSVTVPEPRSEAIVTVEYLILGTSLSTSGGAGRDVLIANQAGDRETNAPTATDDVWVDATVITGQAFDTAANSGYIRIKKLNSGG